MSPRVKPKTFTEEINEAFEREVEAERQLIENQGAVARANRARQVVLRAVSPYGKGSPDSWILDSAAASLDAPDLLAKERLGRFRAHLEENRAQHRVEMRAITTSTLGGLIPTTIPPWTAEAVAYGVRSGAPLAMALERLDLPPVGMNAAWAKVITGATVTNQTAQNTALTASADVVAASATDALQTVGAYLDFSAQTQELSGGWFDRVVGEELGRAFAARLEQQLWSGTGSGGQITGFTQMTGNSSSTVAGQTLANITAKINDQFQQISTNLGAIPDLIAMHPRRYANLAAGTNALGLPFEDVLPDALTIVLSPAAPTNLGAGTNEDWILLLNKASTPLVYDGEPRLEFQQQGPSAGTNLTFRWLIYAYLTLGVSRRPEGVGIIKGATAPSF